MEFRPAEIRRPFRVGADRFPQAFELTPPDKGKVDAVRPRRGQLVQIGRYRKLVGDLLGQSLGNLDALLHRHAGNRHERHDVGRTHARVLALVLVQVNQLGRDPDRPESGVEHRFRLADEADDRAIVVRVHLLVEHRNAVDRLDDVDNLIDYLGPAALAEIGHAFDYLTHKRNSSLNGGSCLVRTQAILPAQTGLSNQNGTPKSGIDGHEITKSDETEPVFPAPIRFVSFVASMSVSGDCL